MPLSDGSLETGMETARELMKDSIVRRGVQTPKTVERYLPCANQMLPGPVQLKPSPQIATVSPAVLMSSSK